MEKGLTWIGLFIALAPMLGFLGTVIGMIDAFDQIQAAGDTVSYTHLSTPRNRNGIRRIQQATANDWTRSGISTKS